MDKHKAIFYGVVAQKVWIHYYGTLNLSEEPIDNEVILETELDNPPLEAGESIFIHTIQKSVRVSRVCRSTDGGHVYYTDHIIRVEENEEKLKKSKDDATKLINERKEKELKNRREREIEKYNDMNWLVRLFTKKPESLN